ncbi:metal-dependent transcriptional regulator [Actinomyces sp. B33]|uniref:metal-dependent transcriptional regulator n=1 Tax=Actinomyces sp. B33 TaxID=2942131 RepID=UPI00234266DC|nr:metal-dependent transcriptional regulator [Actinomyces sp. B33]MDC4232880.1 metal-dependent transcriptional regulator [Actinomyces sp. B33]
MDALVDGWLTPVAQDYLKALWSADEAGARGMSVNELAARSGVVASTASENVRRLTAQGLLSHEPYQKVHLTEKGRRLAIGMIRRHRLLETYLHQALGFEWDEVHAEAEILEHAVSDRLLDRLDAVLGYPTRDPHGDPIPREDGTVCARPRVPLAQIPVGDRARIVRLSDGDAQILRDLDEAGLVLDTVVEVADRDGDRVSLARGDGGARVTIAEEASRAIWVEPLV